MQVSCLSCLLRHFPLLAEATCQIPASAFPGNWPRAVASHRLKAEAWKEGMRNERTNALHCIAAASAVPEREGLGRLGGCIVTSAGGWPGVRAESKAGEGTRCRRARTSCQRRTCGHLRFMIGQCIAGRSPTCTPRMREGASWPLAEEGGRGLPTCRWVQGLPAEEIVWGRRAAAGTYPFLSLFAAGPVLMSCRVGAGWRGTHTL